MAAGAGIKFGGLNVVSCSGYLRELALNSLVLFI